MWKVAKRAALLMPLVALSGCGMAGASTAPESSVTPNPMCTTMQPVCITADDVLTESTAKQIEKNNLAHLATCPKRKKRRCAATP